MHIAVLSFYVHIKAYLAPHKQVFFQKNIKKPEKNMTDMLLRR